MKNTDFLKMNLQYFADDPGSSDQDQNDSQPTGSDHNDNPLDDAANNSQGDDHRDDDNNSSAKKYTDDQVNEIVKRRLARAEAEKQKAVTEAQKYAKMNADQKKEYELQKTQKELEEAKAQINKFSLLKQARSSLESEELPVSFSDDDLAHVVTAEAESTNTNVDWLKDLATRIADSVRKSYLQGSTPKVTGQPAKGVTQADFDKMSYDERAKIATQNPDLFAKLTGGN